MVITSSVSVGPPGRGLATVCKGEERCSLGVGAHLGRSTDLESFETLRADMHGSTPRGVFVLHLASASVVAAFCCAVARTRDRLHVAETATYTRAPQTQTPTHTHRHTVSTSVWLDCGGFSGVFRVLMSNGWTTVQRRGGRTSEEANLALTIRQAVLERPSHACRAQTLRVTRFEIREGGETTKRSRRATTSGSVHAARSMACSKLAAGDAEFSPRFS